MGKLPWDEPVPDNKAAMWWLGQAGYYMKCGKCTLLIDPYLTDSVSKSAPLFARAYPAPVQPEAVKADIFIVTHDHMDHLDPETITRYHHKDTTIFVSGRHAAKHLIELGISQNNIKVVGHGDFIELPGVRIDGIFALATDPNTLDTTGIKITFANEKSVYHSSDTAFCDLLLKACPKADVLLTCINGKFGNLNIAEAVELTKAVKPKYVIPNHYDVMALNSENPESFRYFCQVEGSECRVLTPLEQFMW